MKMSALTGLALLLGFGVLLSACGSNVGRPLGGDAPSHHLENGFRNPPNSPKRDIPFTRRLKFFSQAIWRNAFSKAPSIPTDHAIMRDAAKAQLAAMGDEDFVSWIGHATFLVRLDGVNVLTDPVFSRRASPMSFANHRVRAERAATRPLAAGCGEREGGRERERERERDTSMDVRSLYVR